MAHADEALDLKRRARRRLIGAIALVLFLVIVPPWVMDLEPKPVETSLEVEIPKPDQRQLPLPAQAERKDAAPAVAEGEAPPADAAPEAPGAEAKPAAEPAPKAEPQKAESKPAPKEAAETKAKTSERKTADVAYIVPVATLSEKGNVKELQAKVSLAGIETYTEVVKTSSGQRTRVRAGPFATKEEAERTRDRLREMGLKPGNVTTR